MSANYLTSLNSICMMNLSEKTLMEFFHFLEKELERCLTNIRTGVCNLKKYDELPTDLVQRYYEEAKQVTAKYFSFIPSPVSIKSTSEDIMGPYYLDNTFVFNPSNSVMKSDVLKCVILHETCPGHHLMFNYMDQHNLPIDDNIAFIEGWALYAESLCDKKDECKYFMSRLIRIVRSLADIYLNYFGRDKDTVMTFFKKYNHLMHLDLQKEFTRLQEKAGYNVCYTLGEQWFFKLRREYRKAHPEKSIKEFHEWILSHGVIPFTQIAKLV